MADPIVVKVSELNELTNLATGDLLEVVDISEEIAADKTKKIQAGNLKLFTASQIADGIVTGTNIATATITADNFTADVNNEIKKNLVYIQLFQPDEAILGVTGRTQFFVPAHLAGKKVRQIGIGIVTAETGKTVTVELGTFGAYGSISGEASKEEYTTKTLPSALTKIPINVSVTAGTPAPKGLDFWFLVY